MLSQLLKRDVVFLDNAYGWILLKSGLKPGQRPDIMNMTAPEIVESLQRKAVEAGSDIVCTNTFGANAKTLKNTGYTVEEIVRAAVAVTKRAAAGRALVALDIGPIGDFIKPFGTLSFDESYDLYREQAVIAEEAGADLVAIETMSDLYEVKAAIRAVRENTKLPVFAMMTFDRSGRSFTGCRPESFAVTAERLGAAAVGINCSLAPGEIFPIADKLCRSTSLPVIIKPNAGLPNSVTGAYDIGPEEFARQMAAFAALGVKIVGGCCGTSPETIAALRRTYGGLKPTAVPRDKGPCICTPMHAEVFDRTVLDGMAAAGTAPDAIIENALDQSDGGSAVVTVQLPDGLAPDKAAQIIRSIQTQSDRPLVLVSGDIIVLEAALREIPGSPAVACTGCNGAALSALASKYGALAI